MNPTLDAFLRSWPWTPWLLAGTLLSAFVYWRGWRILRRRDPRRWSGGRLAAFLGGLAAIYIALASPIEPFAYFYLQVHMVQHLLLTMVAPPLFWLGAPLFPVLRGLPQPIRIHWAAPCLRSRPLRTTLTRVIQPLPALAIFTAVTWLWHIPALYDLAMRSPGWHYVQHVCLLGAGLVFWHPVIRPYPSRPAWSMWWLPPYLILADVQNTILSALLTFSGRVLYAHYESVPRLGYSTALDDQAAAGVLMWVPGSVAFLLPLFWIGLRLLFPPSSARAPVQSTDGRVPLPLVSAIPDKSFDLLRLPLVGRFLRWRHARLCLQLPLLALAMLIVIDGFRGPQVGAMNLAGVLPWVHWRGLVVIALLVCGNLFCLACPFLVPRTLARKFKPASWDWPRWLRNKWLAVALILVFLWAYEAYALWDSPWLTAWIILAYFGAAFIVDAFFRGAAFCKYMCPLGQFNFVQSLVSPVEVKVRDSEVCASCRTKDCIRGRDGIPGCELDLFQPRKVGNMDCTFCLDCVHACPHDNIGMPANLSGSDLWRDPPRSGIGRFSKRLDLAALVLVLVFGAFVNAALMTGPVAAWHGGLSAALGNSPRLATALMCLVGLVAAPVVLFAAAATISRRWGWLAGPRLHVAARYAYAFVPLGFAMWLAHYSFHLFTSFGSAIPVAQRFAEDAGWTFLGSPEWSYACCIPPADWLLRLEIVLLDFGLLMSLYAGYRIARAQTPTLARTYAALAPWALLMFMLFAAGVWIIFQPMEMRGALS